MLYRKSWLPDASRNHRNQSISANNAEKKEEKEKKVVSSCCCDHSLSARHTIKAGFVGYRIIDSQHGRFRMGLRLRLGMGFGFTGMEFGVRRLAASSYSASATTILRPATSASAAIASTSAGAVFHVRPSAGTRNMFSFSGNCSNKWFVSLSPFFFFFLLFLFFYLAPTCICSENAPLPDSLEISTLFPVPYSQREAAQALSG